MSFSVGSLSPGFVEAEAAASLIRCCRYILCTLCPDQPAGAPTLYVGTRQIDSMGLDGIYYFRFGGNTGKWCFKLDTDDEPVCALPSGGTIPNLRLVSFFGDCTCPDPPSGGPNPDEPIPDLPEYQAYIGVPCAGAPSWLSAGPVYGYPTEGLAHGTYTMHIGGWCYTFVVDGFPTTVMTPPNVWIINNIANCDACRAAQPIYICGNQELPRGFKFPYVRLVDAPSTSMIWEWNGVIVYYDPAAPVVTKPESGVWVIPRDEFDSCAEGTAGFLATLCEEQPPGADLSLAAVLWIRRVRAPASLVVDVRSGLYYKIDPDTEDTPKPSDAIDWVYKGDFSTCGPCLARSNFRGIRWLVCQRDPRARRAKRLWTKEAELPDHVVYRAINYISYYLPLEPIDDIPLGGATIPPLNEGNSCAELIDDNAHDGKGGPTGGGGGDSTDPNDNDGGSGDTDDDEPDDNDKDGGDGNCKGCGGGNGGGDNCKDCNGDDTGPHPPGYCETHVAACFNRLKKCDSDPPEYMNVRVPNATRGTVVLIGGDCWEIVAVDGSTPFADLPYPKVDPSTIEGYRPSCAICNVVKHCYYTWQLNCDTMVISQISVTCATSDPPGLNTWSGSPPQITTKGIVCITDGSCPDSLDGPSYPDPAAGCPDCSACPIWWATVFAACIGPFGDGWSVSCKSIIEVHADLTGVAGIADTDYALAGGPLTFGAFLHPIAVDTTFDIIIQYQGTLVIDGITWTIDGFLDVTTASFFYSISATVDGDLVGAGSTISPLACTGDGDAEGVSSDEFAQFQGPSANPPADGADGNVTLKNFSCCGACP